MRATLQNLQSELSARTSGPAKAPPRGRASGLSFRRLAQGWQLWTTQLTGDPTAGIDLGTAILTWRPQVTTPLWSDTPSQRTLRPERRHQSLAIVPPGALPVNPPGWEANDALKADFDDGDLTSSVGETAASEASTRLGIRRLLQRQQPPARQSRRLRPHSRRHMLLRPAEVTSRVRPLCRMRMTAAFYCNRRPKRLLLERGCTDGTGPRPSIEP